MTIFVSYEYNFDRNNAEGMINLIKKYFTGVKCTFTIDNNKYEGKISNDFINSLPQGNNYNFLSKKISNQRLTLLNMKKCDTTQNSEDQIIKTVYKKEIKAITDFIDYVSSDHDIYMYPPKFEKKIKLNDMNKLLNSIIDPRITRYTVLQNPFAIILGICDKQAIIIDQDCVDIIQLPVFDIDEGFIKCSFNKWNEAYDHWMNLCTDDNFASWDKLKI